MYINKIDEIIDSTIDIFNDVILKDKIFSKIKKDDNFVKYQKNINEILLQFDKIFNLSDMEKLIIDADNLNTVINIIKKYIAYYIFLYIGFYYNGEEKTFINNIIEFTKNQPSFNYKAKNFFTTKSNSKVINFYIIIKHILKLLSADKAQLNTLTKEKKYKTTINFLNVFGKEFVDKNFRLDGLNGDEEAQAHNIIKTLILNELYFGEDKKEVQLILEESSSAAGKYIYINIVVPRKEYIDYYSIESVLDKKEIDNGMAYRIYELIKEYEDTGKKILTPDEKILKILNNKIVVPVTEDFMLYHKDTEKYEKIFVKDAKKKEDTKLRYIVTKIDSITEYFSEKMQKSEKDKKELEKHFYQPLNNRKAILINELEEQKIISKLLNMGQKVIQNNEYYNDLVSYRKYPYINFKDFSKDGFSIKLDKTIDVMRYTTIFDDEKRDIQLRIGSNEQTINVVGFLIPANTYPLPCIKRNNLININKIKYKNDKNVTSNGFDNAMRLFKNYVLTRKQLKHSCYWLFDLEKDTIEFENYEQIKKMNKEQQTLLVLSKMYDEIIILMYRYFLDYLNSVKVISLYQFKRFVEYVESYLVEFPKDSRMYKELISIVTYEKYENKKIDFDKRENIFFGLTEDSIKLPEHKIEKTNIIPVISIKKLIDKKEEIELTEIEKTQAICQHFITWEKMSEIRKTDPNKFSTELFSFINKYVIERGTDYICKSCGTKVNIQNYVSDGVFDENGQYITFSMPLSVPIEEIPEYEKYKQTIHNLDKIIDRIASVCNMTYFIGVKTRRRAIVKDTIDLLLLHNRNLKDVYKNRNEKVHSLYGIDKELTNLFVFELENSIFFYSSKDKDFFKKIKQNNVLIYILFLMVLELNDAHIMAMVGDKICNYYFFEKYGQALFNNMKIIKNNKGDVDFIQNYPALCYIIYYTSCMITKYNMWYYESDQKKKFNLAIQKTIVNTLVDFINSVLEFYGNKKKQYLYDIVSLKFFRNINGVFSNKKALDKLQEMQSKKIVTIDGKKKIISTRIKNVNVAEYWNVKEPNVNEFKKCTPSRYYLNKRINYLQQYKVINNLTNCETGTFHNWKLKGKTFQCIVCDKTMDKINQNANETQKAIANYDYNVIREISKKFCKKGKYHMFNFDQKLKCIACVKCKMTDVSKLSDKDLEEIKNIIIETKKTNIIKNIEILDNKKETAKKQSEAEVNIINELKAQFSKNKKHKEDFLGFIDPFINIMLNVLGDKIIKNNKEDVSLVYDTYVIDHDHNGYKIDNTIVINEKDNKIFLKKNHPFFKRDVLFYTNLKVGKIDVFYDPITLLLLGYKEQNKDFELAKYSNRYIKINYSVKNRIKYMGYPSKYINIESNKETLKEYYKNTKDSEQTIIKEIISNISRNRIKNLKKVITDFQRFINRIKYDFEIVNVEEKLIEIENITSNYKEMLKDMKNTTESGETFDKWNTLKYQVNFRNIKDVVNLSLESQYFFVEDISKYDYHGNLILFYIINELTQLININKNSVLKVNVTKFILDIINRSHDMFNKEFINNNFEIKRFNYILTSNIYSYDFEKEGFGLSGETSGIYEEYVDENDAISKETIDSIEDDIEEADAIDIDTEMDYQIDYSSGINAPF